tara:strand:- start:325 stop:588 length:264 start_codon:yes stop_codon:yes gene_type:complete
MVGSRDYAIEEYDAVEQPDGSYVDDFGDITWYNKAGDFHREDGPSIIYTNGNAYWYIHGISYDSFAEWLIELNKPDESKMLLRLQYA